LFLTDEELEGDEDVKPGKSSKKPPAKEGDSEVAFQKLTDVKKFDYLLGMSMWMLTDERKNELLKQRDHKLSELRILKAKTKENLWIEDLDALSKKLEEVEEAERQEELQFLKKQAKIAAAKKPAAGGGGRAVKRASMGGKKDETKPNPDGMEVEFKVSAELIKKYEKIAEVAKRPKKEKVVAGSAEGAVAVEDGPDEFDALVEGGVNKALIKEPVKREPKAKKEPKPKAEKKSDGMKQTKLKFPAGTKGKGVSFSKNLASVV
jgi:DNA topoisomerase II